jgi:hypothetical protein
MAERLRQQIIPQEAAFAAIESEPKKGEANQVADKH